MLRVFLADLALHVVYSISVETCSVKLKQHIHVISSMYKTEWTMYLFNFNDCSRLSFVCYA